MLIAARSSQDFACCLRATASARSKYAFNFRHVRVWGLQRDFPCNPIDLRFAPPFIRGFDHRHRLANAAPCILNWSSSANTLVK
jgi:hypothetical protein